MHPCILAGVLAEHLSECSITHNRLVTHQRDRCGVAGGSGDVDRTRIVGGFSEKRPALSFGSCLTASPGAIEFRLRLRQILFAQPAKQSGHVDVPPHALNVHTHRNRPRNGNNRPIARVREIEFDLRERQQRGFAVLAVSESKPRRIVSRVPRENQAQPRSCPIRVG